MAIGVASAAIGLLLIAGCGGSSSDDSASAAPAGTSRMTVAVESVGGTGDVLVDSHGAALYMAHQEGNGKILCTNSCTDIWIPLTLKGNRQPSGPSSVSNALGVTKRPDGARQLTFDGKPLYRFAEDTSPGEVTGNGVSDSFSGRMFSWQVATANGGSGGGAQQPAPTPYG
jgi:predicted lipoprotein with Yx(FWY)xxD motif